MQLTNFARVVKLINQSTNVGLVLMVLALTAYQEDSLKSSVKAKRLRKLPRNRFAFLPDANNVAHQPCTTQAFVTRQI